MADGVALIIRLTLCAMLLLFGCVASAPAFNTIRVVSGGQRTQQMAQLAVNGVSVPNFPTLKGLNVAVLNEYGSEVLNVANFETHTMSAHSQHLIQFLANVGPNEIVAIAVNDDGRKMLSQEAINAIEGFGSMLIEDLEIDMSWAMVGSRNPGRFAVAEQQSMSSLVAVTAAVLPAGAPVPTTHVFMQAAGHTDWMNGKAQCAAAVEGKVAVSPALTVMAFHADGRFRSDHTYDNVQAAAEAVTFVDRLAVGSPVAILLCNATTMLVAIRTTLQSIGSAIADTLEAGQSFGIVGRVGAAQGSVFESRFKFGPIGIHSAVLGADPDVPPPKSDLPPLAFPITDIGAISVHSAALNHGNTFSVKVNGRTVPFTSGRGWNAVVVSPFNWTVVATRTFDLWGGFDAEIQRFVSFLGDISPDHLLAIGIQNTGYCCYNDQSKNTAMPSEVVAALLETCCQPLRRS